MTPFADQAEITAETNYFGTINVCNALFPLLRDHARFVDLSEHLTDRAMRASSSVVNVSSRLGMLETIKNTDVRKRLIAPNATIETVSDVLSDFIK